VIAEARIGRMLQAADWFVRVSEEQISEREFSEWLQWCTDPDNLREFQRIRATSEGFDQLPAEMTQRLDEILRTEAAAGQTDSPATPAASLPPETRARGWSVKPALAALAASIVIVCAAWYARDALAPATQPPIFESGSANRSTLLPDGSTLILAPRTRVAVDFVGRLRKLALSRGEAYFKVQHDKSKPFVVSAGAVDVTAVGTAFDVRLEEKRITVTVQEGAVAVDLSGRGDGNGSPGGARWQVSAGHRISYDPGKQWASITTVDADLVLGWREGRLQYFDEPLGAVVADVSRYTSQPVLVNDPRLAARRFTGTVFTDAIEDWLAALASTFPARAITRSDGSVLLVPSAADPASRAGQPKE
jgi:transmembrane sensor